MVSRRRSFLMDGRDQVDQSQTSDVYIFDQHSKCASGSRHYFFGQYLFFFSGTRLDFSALTGAAEPFSTSLLAGVDKTGKPLLVLSHDREPRGSLMMGEEFGDSSSKTPDGDLGASTP